MITTIDKARESRRTWYQKNKKKQIDQQKSYRPKRRKAVRVWINEYKSNLVCERCPENHPATLDFHHLNSSTKEFSIAEAVRCGYSIERIKNEISKCIVLCANCHRKLHYDIELAPPAGIEPA